MDERLKCFNDSYFGEPEEMSLNHIGVVKIYKCEKDGQSWGEWELCETCAKNHISKGWILTEIF